MNTYLNIARWAKQAGRRIRVINRDGIPFTGAVDYFFEKKDNTVPECTICMESDDRGGLFFNESDILCIEVA